MEYCIIQSFASLNVDLLWSRKTNEELHNWYRNAQRIIYLRYVAKMKEGRTRRRKKYWEKREMENHKLNGGIPGR